MDVLFRTSSWTSSSTGDGEYQRGVHCAQICTLESLCRGHNELDEPAFTQPLMYQKIRSRKSVPVQYEEKLLVRLTLPPFLPPSRACPHSSLRPELPRSQTENLISKEDVSALRTSYKSHLDEHLAQADAYKPSTAALFQGQWKGIVWPASEDAVRDPDNGVRGGGAQGDRAGERWCARGLCTSCSCLASLVADSGDAGFGR